MMRWVVKSFLKKKECVVVNVKDVREQMRFQWTFFLQTSHGEIRSSYEFDEQIGYWGHRTHWRVRWYQSRKSLARKHKSLASRNTAREQCPPRTSLTSVLVRVPSCTCETIRCVSWKLSNGPNLCSGIMIGWLALFYFLNGWKPFKSWYKPLTWRLTAQYGGQN